MKTASLHIAIFSENYAQSRWCLDELSFMCKTGTKIVPIFYHVKPEDVRYAKGVYAAAFERHKENGRYTSKKLQEWKDALSSVSNNIGHIVNNKEDENMLLKNITYCAMKETGKLPFMVAKHPVGLDEIVEDFEKITKIQSDRSDQIVPIVGIWGMGGAGKTTLAKELYNRRYPLMKKASLILDIRDAAKNNLLCEKQKKLLEDLGCKNVSVDSIEKGKAILTSNLKSFQALIVLDDVDHVDQLDALLPRQGSESLIGSDSLIIVTTRDLEVLRRWNISSRYQMKPLGTVHAKQLFCWHAFIQESPLNGFEEFEKLVENFLEVCNGLPLSLKVLGGQLYGNLSKESWESQLDKFSRVLHNDIKDKLKISYDALDYEEKEAFLDAACFFIGKKCDLVIELWNGSEWSGLYNLERLRNKCLIEIDDQNSIRMHDHLRDLGREIANEQSPYRLWYPQQKIKVCNEQNGIGIRGIVVTSAACFSDEEFVSCSPRGELMVNTTGGVQALMPSTLGLKFIVARDRSLSHVISEASRDLVWLQWYDIEQRDLQSLFPLKKLTVLQLRGNSDQYKPLQELWVDECDAPSQLRVLTFSHCEGLPGLPKSIGRLKLLKKIVLEYAWHLESLPEEFGLLQSLEHLEIKLSPHLLSLPNSMGNLRNLRHLCLKECHQLERLPDSCKELTLLQHLDLDCCFKITLKEDLMENMSNLEYLDFSMCEQLEKLPLHIANQASLRELNLRSVRNLRELPVKIGQLSKLRKLHVGSHSLTSLPASLGDLSCLTTLKISGCTELQCLPDSVGRLSLLERLEIRYSGVKALPESISQLIDLESLEIENCEVSELDLGVGSSLCKLKTIDLSYNNQLSKISISEDSCAGLETLTIQCNINLTEIENLPSSVRKLVISKCPNLSALPSFAQLTSLREFVLRGCKQVKQIEGLNHCRELEVLEAHTGWEVPSIQGIECMERLRTLQLTAMRKSVVEGCIQSLQKWPGEIVVCLRAVQNAASLVNSLAIPSLRVLDSCSNVQISRRCTTKLVVKQPPKGNAIIVCFVMSTRHWAVFRMYSHTIGEYAGPAAEADVEVEEGRWVWIGVFTQRSKWYGVKCVEISLEWSYCPSKEGIVEEGFLAMVQEEKVMEVFPVLMGLRKI
ncbi:hypothetical protein SUGI_0536190 [Cryptomeria japonica]|nr:hypothetical protein SUGI_0536190 [Cryptomeria japonica]